MDKQIKRIGVDARFYGPIGKGLGRYTQEIVDNIIKLDQINNYVIFLRRENYHDFVCPNERVKKILADIDWYGFKEQLVFPWLIHRECLDLMHFPHFNVPLVCPTKFIVTIHDLILIKFPTVRATTLSPWLYEIKNLAYRLVISTAIKRAKKIIAVSGFTKADIVKQFGVKPDKIAVTYEGIAEFKKTSSQPAQNILANYQIKAPYLLYVGNAYPHKNLERLIKIFQKLSGQNPDLQLVLVGKEDYFYRRLKNNCRNVAGVIFPGYVPDHDLAEFYAKAVAYIFPSFYEGFGLPPLEAMAHGCPVASSNQTSLPEILGQAAIYFDPGNENEMLGQINKLISDNNLRSELISRGYEQIKKYSWQDCARKTLEIYLQIFMQN